MNNTKDAMYCRLCAVLKRENQLRELQSDDESCQTVVDQLAKFNIVLDLQENILPKTVCLPCVKSLEKAFRFVTAVEQAQAFLCDFILVKIETPISHSCEENIFHEGEGHDKNDNVHFKDENCQDSMEVNDCGISLNEDFDGEVVTVKNVDDESVINSNPEELKEMENIDDIQPTNDVIKQNIDRKTDCNENPDINHHVNLMKNLLNDVVAKVNNNSKSTNLENTVCSIDEVLKHNDCEVAVAANNMDKSIQQLELKHKERSNKNLLMESNTAVHSLANKTKTKKQNENDQKDSNMAATNTYTDIEQIKMTWEAYEWQCSRCETLFLSVEDLQEHSMQVHNSCNPYQCIDCGMKRSNLKAFMIHVRTHRTDLNYSCYVCFEKFLSIDKVASHRRWEHENSKYICLGCRIPFDNNVELKEHVDKYYKTNYAYKPSDLTCRICNVICANNKDWRKHGLTHKSKEFVCETCGKSFLTKSSLKDHIFMRHDTVNKLFKCDICNSAFKYARALRKHSIIHSGIKPFTCDDCGKSFRAKPTIVQHMKIHMNCPLSYACTVCNKKFRSNTNLRCHMRQHTGAQPFSCDICLRDFTDLSNRNKHMRRKHGIEMAKRRQLTADGPTSSDLEIKEVRLWNTNHRRSRKANSKNKKEKNNRN